MYQNVNRFADNHSLNSKVASGIDEKVQRLALLAVGQVKLQWTHLGVVAVLQVRAVEETITEDAVHIMAHRGEVTREAQVMLPEKALPHRQASDEQTAVHKLRVHHPRKRQLLRQILARPIAADGVAVHECNVRAEEGAATERGQQGEIFR